MGGDWRIRRKLSLGSMASQDQVLWGGAHYIFLLFLYMFRPVRVPVMNPKVSCGGNGILGDPQKKLLRVLILEQHARGSSQGCPTDSGRQAV